MKSQGEKKDYSEVIVASINKFLVEDDWRYGFDDRSGIFNFGLSLSGKIKNIRYIIIVHENSYTVYAISSLGADSDDEEMMANMAEFICRANYGLKMGNFEFDMRDGEIRYKVFVACSGLTPCQELIRESIFVPAAMFDRYATGIVNIILGDDTAEEAISRCE